jgi:hypothetical protein
MVHVSFTPSHNIFTSTSKEILPTISPLFSSGPFGGWRHWTSSGGGCIEPQAAPRTGTLASYITRAKGNIALGTSALGYIAPSLISSRRARCGGWDQERQPEEGHEGKLRAYSTSSISPSSPDEIRRRGLDGAKQTLRPPCSPSSTPSCSPLRETSHEALPISSQFGLCWWFDGLLNEMCQKLAGKRRSWSISAL